MTLNVTNALSRIEDISPTWWGAIAGAVAAGAVAVPTHRVLAGAALGGAVLWLALRRLAPCCQSCAEGKGCEGAPLDDAPAAAAFAGGNQNATIMASMERRAAASCG